MVKFSTKSILAAKCSRTPELIAYNEANNTKYRGVLTEIISEKDFLLLFDDLKQNLPIPILYNYQEEVVGQLTEVSLNVSNNGVLFISGSGELENDIPTDTAYVSVGFSIEKSNVSIDGTALVLDSPKVWCISYFLVPGTDDIAPIDLEI